MTEQLLRVRNLEGYLDYEDTWKIMLDFTHQREADTMDELWLLQHAPVFTLGQAGKEEHILRRTSTPIVKSDRGGQVTYHGPGQLVGYCLFNIERLGINIRDYVTALENLFIDYLANHGITATANPKAPGVYVDGAKIASIGLRVHKGSSYHGFSFNVDMDLSPFNDINPCGYANQAMTSLKKLGIEQSIEEVENELLELIYKAFNYQRSC
jgi:lipoyl(octanoyl) transferase